MLAKPLGDRVLIKETREEQKTSSGIIIPDTATLDNSKTAEVVAVGDGLFTQNGVSIPMSVKPGDIVVMPPYHQGQEITLGGEKYVILRESELLMVCK